jgi:hypothetical protein
VTITATPTVTPTTGATPTPIDRVCTIGGPTSLVALQFKNVPLFGNLRATGSLTGSQTFRFGAEDPVTGVRPVTVLASSIDFDPVVIPIPIVGNQMLCVESAGIDGTGKIDCNGGEANLNLQTKQDHNTFVAPGSNGGLPVDPECNDTRTAPDGAISTACLETAMGTCNATNAHPGICNSPLEYTESATFGSGDSRITETLLLKQVTNVGMDGIQCTSDDTYGTVSNVRVFFTTGLARATVYDAKNVSNSLLDHMTGTGTLGCANCITQVPGAPKACSAITPPAGNMTGFKIAGAIPVLDLNATAGDAAVTIEATCQ